MTSLPLSGVVVSTAMAVAAGLLGSFTLMRRMTLAADALSHVALPGIGVALVLRVNPIAGAAAALVAGVILVWSLEQRTGLATETVVGVIFSTALALGVLLTTGEQLIDALFGAPGTLATWEMLIGLAGAALVIAFVVLARDRLILSIVSREIALTAGIDVRRLDLLYLLAFALVIALGLRYLGVLLMGSLLIIPPAAARQLARNLSEMLVLSVAGSVSSTLVGSWLAARFNRESGPVIVLVAGVLFLGATVVGTLRRSVSHPIPRPENAD